MWDLSSPARDRTHTPCIGKQSLNHWTTSEVPEVQLLVQVLKGIFKILEAGAIACMDNTSMTSNVFWLSASQNSTQLAVRRLRFHAWLCHFLDGKTFWSWASHLICLIFSFLICKTGE